MYKLIRFFRKYILRQKQIIVICPLCNGTGKKEEVDYIQDGSLLPLTFSKVPCYCKNQCGFKIEVL